jgi:hypothetical protein
MASSPNLSVPHSRNNPASTVAELSLLDYEPDFDCDIPEETYDTDWQDFVSYHEGVRL